MLEDSSVFLIPLVMRIFQAGPVSDSPSAGVLKPGFPVSPPPRPPSTQGLPAQHRCPPLLPLGPPLRSSLGRSLSVLARGRGSAREAGGPGESRLLSRGRSALLTRRQNLPSPPSPLLWASFQLFQQRVPKEGRQKAASSVIYGTHRNAASVNQQQLLLGTGLLGAAP